MKNIVLVAAGLLLTGVFTALFINKQGEFKYLLSPKGCKLTVERCTLYWNSKKLFSMDFPTRPLSNKVPFKMSLRILDPNWSIDSISSEFRGVEMDLFSSSQMYLKDETEFIGNGTLPYCTLKKMTWNFGLEIKAFNKKENRLQQFYLKNQLEVIN